jgi:hypothetical protein
MESTNTFGLPDDAAAGRLRRLLNEGMLALVTGLGSRAGWLDALAAVQPARGDAVARAARADETRVLAWLGALVAGRLVEYDGAAETYALEPGLARFLCGEAGRAYARGLGELVSLAGALPRAPFRAAAGPSPVELLALAPGLATRVERGASVLVLGARAEAVAGALAAAFPAARPTLAARGVPRGARGIHAALVLDEGGHGRPARLHEALADGGVAIIAVPGVAGSPADDALHPVGAFLLGARALAARAAAQAPLPARLAAAGFEIRGLARVPSDPFRDYVVVNKPVSQR